MLIGIERSQISKIERGLARTCNKRVQKLCGFFEVSPLGRSAVSEQNRLETLQARIEALAKGAPHLLLIVEATLAAIELAAGTLAAPETDTVSPH